MTEILKLILKELLKEDLTLEEFASLANEVSNDGHLLPMLQNHPLVDFEFTEAHCAQ